MAAGPTTRAATPRARPGPASEGSTAGATSGRVGHRRPVSATAGARESTRARPPRASPTAAVPAAIPAAALPAVVTPRGIRAPRNGPRRPSAPPGPRSGRPPAPAVRVPVVPVPRTSAVAPGPRHSRPPTERPAGRPIPEARGVAGRGRCRGRRCARRVMPWRRRAVVLRGWGRTGHSWRHLRWSGRRCGPLPGNRRTPVSGWGRAAFPGRATRLPTTLRPIEAAKAPVAGTKPPVGDRGQAVGGHVPGPGPPRSRPAPSRTRERDRSHIATPTAAMIAPKPANAAANITSARLVVSDRRHRSVTGARASNGSGAIDPPPPGSRGPRRGAGGGAAGHRGSGRAWDRGCRSRRSSCVPPRPVWDRSRTAPGPAPTAG